MSHPFEHLNKSHKIKFQKILYNFTTTCCTWTSSSEISRSKWLSGAPRSREKTAKHHRWDFLDCNYCRASVENCSLFFDRVLTPCKLLYYALVTFDLDTCKCHLHTKYSTVAITQYDVGSRDVTLIVSWRPGNRLPFRRCLKNILTEIHITVFAWMLKRSHFIICFDLSQSYYKIYFQPDFRIWAT